MVCAEEHMLNGGLTDTAAQMAALNFPIPIEAVAITTLLEKAERQTN